MSCALAGACQRSCSSHWNMNLVLRYAMKKRIPSDLVPTSTVLWLAAASLAFWAAWLLMPGVGITDTATIFSLVGRHRTQVLVSVCVQLLSAAAYAPGIVCLLCQRQAAGSRAVRWGAALLAIGAMGSAADAIFHLVAYEMTAPHVDTAAMVPVMQALQGPDLRLLAPMIIAFFAGHALLAWAGHACGRLGRLSWTLLLGVAPVFAVLAAAKRAELVSGRALGLTVLALVSMSLPLAASALSGSRPGVGAKAMARWMTFRSSRGLPGQV